MKLTYAQLELHVSKNITPIYLISGDEPFLKNQAIALIRKAAKLAQYLERERVYIQTQVDADQIYSILYTTSLFVDKKIIEFDLQDCLPTKEIGNILAEYTNNINSNYLLIFNLPKVDNKIAKSNWFCALEKAGHHVPLWPVGVDKMPQWINERARKYKMTLTSAATFLLTELSAGNLTAAAQAIEKLYLLKSGDTIDEKMIELVANNESRFNIFDLIDYVIAKDVTHTLQTLQNLKEEGIEPTLVLWGITRELRMLAEFTQQKLSLDRLLQQYRIFPRRQMNIKKFVRETSYQQCLQWLAKAIKIDGMIKGAIVGNAWQALELYCLDLCSVSANVSA